MPKQCPDCTETQLCWWHKRRKEASTKKPLKRTPIKKKQYSIKKRSNKRAKQENKYNYEARKFKQANQRCKAGIVLGNRSCSGSTTDVHHMAGRENELLLKKEYWLPVCRNCHEWITRNSKQAIELGLSISRLK